MTLYRATSQGEIPLTKEEELNYTKLDQEDLLKLSVLAATEYQRARSAEYPPITDYIDGIVKGDQTQVQTYIDACLAVKAKYPKPQ
jgi:hypothetical protein